MEDCGRTDCNFCCPAAVYVYFLVVVDADVPGVGEISCAVEQGAAEGRDHFYCARRVTEGVPEKADV